MSAPGTEPLAASSVIVPPAPLDALTRTLLPGSVMPPLPMFLIVIEPPLPECPVALADKAAPVPLAPVEAPPMLKAVELLVVILIVPPAIVPVLSDVIVLPAVANDSVPPVALFCPAIMVTVPPLPPSPDKPAPTALAYKLPPLILILPLLDEALVPAVNVNVAPPPLVGPTKKAEPIFTVMSFPEDRVTCPPAPVMLPPLALIETD